MKQLFKAMVRDPALAISVAVATSGSGMLAVNMFRHFPVKFEHAFVNGTANCECGILPKVSKASASNPARLGLDSGFRAASSFHPGR